jgi:hypothetical protein
MAMTMSTSASGFGVVVVVDDGVAGVGGSSVLSVPSVPPPLINSRATMARATMTAAPATKLIARGSFHHSPRGSSSRSQASSGDTS